MCETIKLDYPIQLEGRTLDAVSIRRPKARDLKKMESSGGGDVTKSIDLIANLAEVPPLAIEELDAADFQKLSEKVAGFLGKQ